MTTAPRPVSTALGYAVPPAANHAPTPHSVTSHLPGWQIVLDVRDKKPEVFAKIKTGYPRMTINNFIKQLSAKVTDFLKVEGYGALLVPTYESAEECVKFATTIRHDGTILHTPDEVSIRVLEVGLPLYVVLFKVDPTKPPSPAKTIFFFWILTGLGISSRYAEECLKHEDEIREVPAGETLARFQEAPSHLKIKQRIADLVERAPVGPARELKTSPDDIYLVQSGMTAIYYVHKCLLDLIGSKSVILGIPFHITIHLFEEFGPGSEVLGLGTELDTLEALLKSEKEKGTPIQAVWTEFPSNPMLTSSDLTKLRKLADEYDFVLVVDETIGGFCNVDVMGVADVVVTSLTKAFNGYADLLAGGVIFPPTSKKYSTLKPHFEKICSNSLFTHDADLLLENSANYFERSKILNNNASSLVDYLQSLVSDPSSSVSGVYYPSVAPTKANYDAYMRPSTSEFPEPGYGCLFSVDFETVDQTIAFYNHLYVHQSPHLGAHCTLALAYIQALFGNELEKVGKAGLKESMIRVSVGLEDTQELIDVFKYAISMADKVKRGETV